MAYALAGIPLMLLYMASVGDILASAFRYAYFNFLCRGKRRRRPKRTCRRTVSTRSSRGTKDSEESDSEYGEEGGLEASDGGGGRGRRGRVREKQIPVWACLSVIAGFVAGGATLFSAWEGWPLLDAAYFCVVSLVTLGFGDLVPGDAFGGTYSSNFTMPSAEERTATGVVAPPEAYTIRSLLGIGDFFQSRELRSDVDYVDGVYEEYVDLFPPATTPPTTQASKREDLAPAFGGVFSDYVTTADMMMVDGKLTFCALYLLTGMALLAMNFHLMQETGLRAARRVLERLKPSWGETKGGGTRKGSATVANARVVGDRWEREGWRRRTWGGEGRRYGEETDRWRGSSAGEVGRTASDSGTEERIPLDGRAGGVQGIGGGVVITLQAEDGAVYDWEPGGTDGDGVSEYDVSTETLQIGAPKGGGVGGGSGGGKSGLETEERSETEDGREGGRGTKRRGRRASDGVVGASSVLAQKSPKARARSLSFRRRGLRSSPVGEERVAGRGRGGRATREGGEGGRRRRSLHRLEVPHKAPPVDSDSLSRSSRSASRCTEDDLSEEMVSSARGASPCAVSAKGSACEEGGLGGEGAGGGGARRGGARRGAVTKKKGFGRIAAWKKKRKRKKGGRRVGTLRQGFQNPFFSTSSLDHIPMSC